MNNKVVKISEQIFDIEQKIADPKLCKGTASVYTRVSGYYRPVNAFNDGKQQETRERQCYLM